jgi:hypothetical protein
VSPAKPGRTRSALWPDFLFLFSFKIVLIAGVGLVVVGVPVLNWLTVQAGLQSPPPPPRPLSVPYAAQPLAVYAPASGWVAEWKWVVCEEPDMPRVAEREVARHAERETPRYACRIFGVAGRLEIVGDYYAHAGTYTAGRQMRPGRLPYPGEKLLYSSLQDPATIVLEWPRGGTLIARGVLLFPARGRKVAVLDDEGHLGEDTAMSPEERAAASR